MAQRNQAMMNSALQFQLPVVGSYQQPNGAMIYYCRDLSGSIVTCRQVH